MQSIDCGALAEGMAHRINNSVADDDNEIIVGQRFKDLEGAWAECTRFPTFDAERAGDFSKASSTLCRQSLLDQDRLGLAKLHLLGADNGGRTGGNGAFDVRI